MFGFFFDRRAAALDPGPADLIASEQVLFTNRV